MARRVILNELLRTSTQWSLDHITQNPRLSWKSSKVSPPITPQKDKEKPSPRPPRTKQNPRVTTACFFFVFFVGQLALLKSKTLVIQKEQNPLEVNFFRPTTRCLVSRQLSELLPGFLLPLQKEKSVRLSVRLADSHNLKYLNANMIKHVLSHGFKESIVSWQYVRKTTVLPVWAASKAGIGLWIPFNFLLRLLSVPEAFDSPPMKDHEKSCFRHGLLQVVYFCDTVACCCWSKMQACWDYCGLLWIALRGTCECDAVTLGATLRIATSVYKAGWAHPGRPK